MATKNYLHHTKNSGFVDQQRKRHVFVSFGHMGRLITDDSALQDELDAAIKAGAPIRLEGSGEATISPAKIDAVQAAKEKLQAVNGMVTTASHSQ